MYRLIKIHNLPDELSGGNNKFLIIDVPDVTSPTGYRSKRISADTVAGLNVQNLEQVLAVGNTTGNLSIVVNELSSVGFEKGTSFKSYLQSPSFLSSDAFVQMPNETGTLNLRYETQWKKIPIYNGSYGLANTGNSFYIPNIKISGRTVFINGRYVLPMPTVSGGTTLDTNGGGYPSKFFSDIYQGFGDGYQIPDARNSMRTKSPILPTVLRPTTTVRSPMMHDVVLYRTLNLNGRIRLTTVSPTVVINANGQLQFLSIETVERNGEFGSSFTKSAHERKWIDKFQNGDSIFEYDNYFNSFDGAFATDKRNVQDTGVNYNFDFDGSRTQSFGGFEFDLNFSYPLSENLSLSQIKTAFDSL
jgi:hypothetical protein